MCGLISVVASVTTFFHLRLILLQRTSGSFVVVRIVVVVVFRDGGRLALDLACFGGRPPPGSLDVCWMTGRGFFRTRFFVSERFCGHELIKGVAGVV